MNGPRVSFPALDGIRALCFVSIFLFHGFYTVRPALRAEPLLGFVKNDLLGNGRLGVNVFFVLSGFLITFLLLEEQAVRRRIDVPRFWLRRILRIWPLYYACVAFGFLVFPLLKTMTGQVPAESAELPFYMLFASNFDIILHGQPDASTLTVLWSIAVEEQFYLFWPVLLVLVPQRGLPWLFAAVIVAGWVFRATHLDIDSHEIHTLSCIGDMAMGAFGALLVRSEQGLRWVRARSRGQVVLLYATFLLVFLLRDELLLTTVPARVFERSLVAVLAMGIIVHQTFGARRSLDLGRWSVLNYLGRISYGLYCLHTIGILATIQILGRAGLDERLWQVMLLQPLVALAITVGMAALSHRYLERPFLKLKDRFAYIHRN